MLVSVGPGIRQDYLTRGLGIGKRVENMGQSLDGDILRVEITSIDALAMFT
jgi:hypothetical protein